MDTLKIRLDAIPAILKRFRQSVLAAAVSGKLTEGWRNGNDYLSINTQFSDIVKYSQVGIVKSSKDQSFHNAVPYFKMNNIGNMGKMTKEDMINVDVTDEELSKFKLLEGDFLFNTRNSYELVGKTCVYKSIKSEAVYNNNILRIRFKHNVSPHFINIFFVSAIGEVVKNKIKSGTTNVAAIYQKNLMKVIIKLPEYKEQNEIVRRVDQLFVFADQIEQRVFEAKKRVDHLTQSILVKAFRGDLTAQWRAENPDLISGENSAEALLERIRAERNSASASTSKKPGKRRSAAT